jgi:hypothetical protein
MRVWPVLKDALVLGKFTLSRPYSMRAAGFDEESGRQPNSFGAFSEVPGASDNDNAPKIEELAELLLFRSVVRAPLGMERIWHHIALLIHAARD